ncbi:MAG: BT4734/BF3469 family protein [Bacteroidota bacterium]
MLESTNSAYKFSLFKNLITKDKPDISIDINDVYRIIKSGFLKNEIESLRRTYNQQIYSELKKTSIQAVTISGLFNQREKEGLIKHSGLIQIDIINIKYNDHLFNLMCNDDFTYLAFKNPDGNKISLIVKIKPSVKTHISQFLALKNYYKKNYDLDLKTDDLEVSKAMLLSYDPNIHINPNAKIFESLHILDLKPEDDILAINKNKLQIVYSKNEEENKVAQIISQLRNHNINLLDTDEKKVEIGFSISNTLGEKGRKYFHEINAISQDYSLKETDTLYNSIMQKTKNHITLATLIHYAKEAGITINRLNASGNYINKNKLQDLYKKLRTRRLEIAKKYGIRTLNPEV